MSKLFGDAGASTQDLARLAEDKKAQGLSGARIIRLALALELGRLPAIDWGRLGGGPVWIMEATV